MIIVSNNVVLSDEALGINENNPLFGYHNLVTSSNITATSSSAGYSVTNLSNTNTANRWQAQTLAPQYLTVDTQLYTDPIDYIALAKHNFGSSGIAVSVEVATTLDLGSPSGWAQVATPALLQDDSPLIIRFTPTICYGVRLKMDTGSMVAFASVMFVGRLLISQRRIYVGHVPITDGRLNRFVNGVSESANFLGRIKLGQLNQTSIELSHLTPLWVRTYLRPFIRATEEQPFFFAWRPGTYPSEVGFVWHTDDPKVSNAMSNGMMQASMNIAGIA